MQKKLFANVKNNSDIVYVELVKQNKKFIHIGCFQNGYKGLLGIIEHSKTSAFRQRMHNRLCTS